MLEPALSAVKEGYAGRWTDIVAVEACLFGFLGAAG